MIDPHRMTRRGALAAVASMPLLTGLAVSGSANGQITSDGNKVLVAFFSRTGNTRLIARQIRRATNAHLIEIEPTDAYPEDYEETVAQAQRERDAGLEPSLRARVTDISAYNTVFLGFPIWGMTTPPLIRTFLSNHDLAAKTIVPFITHGGYGLGQSMSVLAQYAPRANILGAFSKQADQERETLSQVTSWLGGIDTAQ